MNKTKKLIVSSVITVAAIIAIIISIHIMKYIQTKSEAKFSILLKRLNVGMPYPEVEQILGKPYRTLTNQNDVEEWGTVKDNSITSECNLHMFARGDVIPHRFILIYEDKQNHTVRLVTTMGM